MGDDTAHDVFIFRRLTRFMMFTGFRLAEIVGNGSGEIMFLTYTDASSGASTT